MTGGELKQTIKDLRVTQSGLRKMSNITSQQFKDLFDKNNEDKEIRSYMGDGIGQIIEVCIQRIESMTDEEKEQLGMLRQVAGVKKKTDREVKEVEPIEYEKPKAGTYEEIVNQDNQSEELYSVVEIDEDGLEVEEPNDLSIETKWQQFKASIETLAELVKILEMASHDYNLIQGTVRSVWKGE